MDGNSNISQLDTEQNVLPLSNNEMGFQINDDSKKKSKKLFVNFTNKQILITTIIIATLLVVTIIVGSAVYFSLNNNQLIDKQTVGVDSNKNDLTIKVPSLRFIYRHQWMAAPPKANLIDLDLPGKFVVIAHTASVGCQTQAQCVLRVRTIQDFHMESHNWSDIGYNFLIGGDGTVFEGRGWNKEGTHTKGYNTRSICIAFIGTFNSIEPSPRMLNATLMLLNEGVKDKKLDPEYRIYGHRQIMATQSPGDKLFNIITNWTHFSNDVIVY